MTLDFCGLGVGDVDVDVGDVIASDGREKFFPLIACSVANVFGIAAGDLVSDGRGKAQTAFGRQIAMYLAHVHLGLSLTKTGDLFGRDRTTVAYACELVENMRDAPDFDMSLGCLERAFLAVELFAIYENDRNIGSNVSEGRR